MADSKAPIGGSFRFFADNEIGIADKNSWSGSYWIDGFEPTAAGSDYTGSWEVGGSALIDITGGHFDIHPQHYGRAATSRLDATDAARTDMEIALARDCIRLEIPVLGVCGGLQVLAVASGGTLVQDILTEHPGALDHEQPTDPTEPWHPVQLDAASRLASMGEVIQVNSTHHQAVEDPGEMVVTGRAPDGICEVIELPSHRFCVGVQWHPELLDRTPYTALAEAIK